MKKRLLIALAVIFTAAFLSVSAEAASSKVGYINVQKIVSQSNIGKRAKSDIDSYRSEKNSIIEVKRGELESVARGIQQERKKKNMDRERFAQMVTRYQEQKKALERQVEDINAELVKRDKQIVAQILQKASGVLEDIAQRGGYTVILMNPRDLAYLDPDADITDQVVKGLNRL
ncbi:MAG: OmpH family outer membrane protein [Thermodesulfobacteriota bacterium]